MLIKTILNRIEKFKSFVYGDCTLEQIGNSPSIIVEVAARKTPKGCVQNVINHYHPTINSHYVVINMCPFGTSLFTLRTLQDASIAKHMAFELNSSPGVMAKNK